MKYVLEIKSEYEDSFKGVMILGAKGSNLFVDALAVEDLEILNSDYINEHFGELQDEAYQKGINDGSLDVKQRVEGAYQRGLDDAWEAAKKISLMTSDEIEKVFPGAAKYNRYNLGYSGVEAIEKLKAYEEKQKADDDIKVGDEVRDDDGDTYIITCINDDGTFDALYPDGTAFSRADMSIIYELTGRHFDIDKILEAMKE